MARRLAPLEQLPAPEAAAYVRQLFAYDKDTGLLTWNVARRGGWAAPGAEAGSFDHRGHVIVRVDGHRYAASRLIHLLLYGYWPRHRCEFLDNNPRNLAWRNMHFDGRHLKNTRTARYFRHLRALNREADRRIAADPALEQAFHTSDLDAIRVRAAVRRDIMAEQEARTDARFEFRNRPGPPPKKKKR